MLHKTVQTDYGFNTYLFYFNGIPEIRVDTVSLTQEDLENMLEELKKAKEGV